MDNLSTESQPIEYLVINCSLPWKRKNLTTETMQTWTCPNQPGLLSYSSLKYKYDSCVRLFGVSTNYILPPEVIFHSEPRIH